MPNEEKDETIIDSTENNEDTTVEADKTTEGENEDKGDEGEKKPEKTPETPEAKRARLTRELKQLDKKFPVVEKKESKTEKTSTKSGEVDYGKLAFHNSKSDSVKIENEADVEFLQEQMLETGKSQESILNSKWFNAELKERQELRNSDRATPKGTKRSGQSAKDSVEYHLEKYESGQMKLSEMPFEIRKQVLDKALERKKSKEKFVF